MNLMHDFVESCCAVAEQPGWNEAGLQQKGAKSFEFPDGYNDYYGTRPRFSVPEALFNPLNFVPPEVCFSYSSDRVSDERQ